MRYYLSEAILPTTYWITALSLTFLLSIITYYGVEQPFRKKKFSLLKSAVIFYFIPAISVLSFAFIAKNTSSFITDELKYPENIYHNTLSISCLKGDTSKEPELLFIGNSYTGQLNPFIDEVGKKEGWSASVISTNFVHFAFGYYLGKYNSFEKERNQWMEENYHKYKAIVITNYFGTDPKLSVLEPTIQRFLDEGKQVYLVDIHKFPSHNPLKNYYFNNIGLPSVSSPKPLVHKEKFMIELAEKYPQIRYINLKKYLPNDFMIDGKPAMKDNSHLNVYGAKCIAREFMKEEIFYQK